MICNKVSFDTKQVAVNELMQMRKSHNEKSKHLGSKSRPYRCPKCLNFHLTTMSVNEIKRNQRIKEDNRRLRILKNIRGNIDLLWELQESWMQLIIEENVWILICNIAGRQHYVKYYQ